jgi:hypothetical protein
MGNADFLEDCFKHPTYKKGVKTFDGMTVMESASRNNEFDGRIKDLILNTSPMARSLRQRIGPITSKKQI